MFKSDYSRPIPQTPLPAELVTAPLLSGKVADLLDWFPLGVFQIPVHELLLHLSQYGGGQSSIAKDVLTSATYHSSGTIFL